MTKYNLAFTYKPKIPGVRNYTIRQTIRRGDRYKEGDLISWHGWAGVPRHSKWSWRTPYLRVNMAVAIYICPDGFEVVSDAYKKVIPIDFYCWDSKMMNELAKLDGIDPPTGLELRRIFIEMHRLFKEREPPSRYKAQIIRWDGPVIQKKIMEIE